MDLNANTFKIPTHKMLHMRSKHIDYVVPGLPIQALIYTKITFMYGNVTQLMT